VEKGTVEGNGAIQGLFRERCEFTARTWRCLCRAAWPIPAALGGSRICHAGILEILQHVKPVGTCWIPAGIQHVPLASDLYLESDPAVVERMGDELACPWSAALVRRLLARGLDPNRPDWLGKTFLHACAARGDRSIAAVFLDAGADINARDIEFNETPLATAVRSGLGSQEPKLAQRRRRMVEFLRKRGAATNLPDDEPWATPLAGHPNSDWPTSKRFSSSTGLHDRREHRRRRHGCRLHQRR